MWVLEARAPGEGATWPLVPAWALTIWSNTERRVQYAIDSHARRSLWRGEDALEGVLQAIAYERLSKQLWVSEEKEHTL